MRARVLTAAALAVLVVAPVAVADGDPASDVLFGQDSFLPYTKPSASSASRLDRAISGANAKGYRIKVAVIQSTSDLGTAGSLFNRAKPYAGFLGAELRFFYHGHLLVAMPKGFGLYFDGHPTKTADALLRGLPPAASDPSKLTEAAASAVALLAAKDKSLPRYRDVYKPQVFAFPATGAPGTDVQLRYEVYDESLQARATVIVYKGTMHTEVHAFPRGAANGAVDTLTWHAPDMAGSDHRFCVSAVDAAGNRSVKSCAQIVLKP